MEIHPVNKQASSDYSSYRVCFCISVTPIQISICVHSFEITQVKIKTQVSFITIAICNVVLPCSFAGSISHIQVDFQEFE